MQKRKLGGHGLTVGAIGYGAMGAAVGYGPSDDLQSITAIRRAHELGVTHFDTARMYGWGEGEKLLGNALRPIRGEVTIATKFGLNESYAPDSRPEIIRQVVHSSLKNLNVETIDLLYQHIPDPNVPIEDVVGVMHEFVLAGKVKYLGLSNSDEATIRRANAVAPISVQQYQYSIFARDVEPLLSVLEELDVGLIAYSPLARGFLTGQATSRDHYTVDDFRQKIGWWAPGNLEKNLEIVAELASLATEKGVSLSQLSLAWLLARKPYIVPIPGSRNQERVAENISAVELVLTEPDIRRINEIAPSGGVGTLIWGD